jgi:hypothetical protein
VAQVLARRWVAQELRQQCARLLVARQVDGLPQAGVLRRMRPLLQQQFGTVIKPLTSYAVADAILVELWHDVRFEGVDRMRGGGGCRSHR